MLNMNDIEVTVEPLSLKHLRTYCSMYKDNFDNSIGSNSGCNTKEIKEFLYVPCIPSSFSHWKNETSKTKRLLTLISKVNPMEWMTRYNTENWKLIFVYFKEKLLGCGCVAMSKKLNNDCFIKGLDLDIGVGVIWDICVPLNEHCHHKSVFNSNFNSGCDAATDFLPGLGGLMLHVMECVCLDHGCYELCSVGWDDGNIKRNALEMYQEHGYIMKNTVNGRIVENSSVNNKNNSGVDRHERGSNIVVFSKILKQTAHVAPIMSYRNNNRSNHISDEGFTYQLYRSNVPGAHGCSPNVGAEVGLRKDLKDELIQQWVAAYLTSMDNFTSAPVVKDEKHMKLASHTNHGDVCVGEALGMDETESNLFHMNEEWAERFRNTLARREARIRNQAPFHSKAKYLRFKYHAKPRKQKKSVSTPPCDNINHTIVNRDTITNPNTDTMVTPSMQPNTSAKKYGNKYDNMFYEEFLAKADGL